MKTTLLIFCMLGSLALGQDFDKRTELTKDSQLREKLLKELRSVIVPGSSKRQAISAEGEMQAYKGWAFFRGSKLDSGGKDLLSSTHTGALFIRTHVYGEEWRLVSYSTDFKDELFSQWVDKYSLSKELLGQNPKTH